MERRGDHAGRHAVDADLGAGQFLGKVARGVQDKGLGARVQQRARTAAVARGHRTGVDDAAACRRQSGPAGRA
ncbi:hypothetical protein G6F65_023368 [Rhizopus arrhizus]|nr:hypothetical protein G6F65_023368 [Rhizopus arrhizus]